MTKIAFYNERGQRKIFFDYGNLYFFLSKKEGKVTWIMQPYLSRFEYNVLCKRWKSQLAFFGTETAFLYDLFDRYAFRLLASEHYGKLKHASTKLYHLEKDNKELQARLSEQLNLLSIQIQKDNVKDIKPIPYDQGYMERSVTKLIGEYHELFNEVEFIMREKKADRRLLNMTD